MMDVPNCLLKAIRDYRAQHALPQPFSECLDRLEAQGFSLLREPAASDRGVRWHAAGFVVHYVALALDDHRVSEREMGNILALKRIYRLDEGDLLALQRQAIADLLRLETAKLLADERVDDLELMHQADLQRALGLGYDEYLRLTRDSIRPVVEQMLEEARGGSGQRQDEIIRRLQALQTVLRVDRATMTAIWPD
ncbi:hypothetical protein H0E84_09170 [Luteimonas sp. SJ-92]|uniref:Uncharacterized protein n=1 Tax=Luteimonas salinisoli TaxID=2752307 RepID=A0A853JBD4_9GAMM|nr:hypothetical protein [Luteimonas salinisoli]NZA26556.1 hypothetical protein [Luteimonas salinisoli]